MLLVLSGLDTNVIPCAPQAVLQRTVASTFQRGWSGFHSHSSRLSPGEEPSGAQVLIGSSTANEQAHFIWLTCSSHCSGLHCISRLCNYPKVWQSVLYTYQVYVTTSGVVVGSVL